MAKEIYKIDLYEIIGVSEDAGDKEIVKGYRKKALKCHPDKNPGNPKAAELFHQLSKALEILTDAAARAAYDQSRRAKKAAEERNRALDSKRKKFREDLEARERSSCVLTSQERETAEQKLQAEIERLRKEGSRLLQQEQERMRTELSHQRSEFDADLTEKESQSETARIKLKWRADKDDPTNGGYTQDTLTNILGCYGRITTLIISHKRTGSALVEFEKSTVSCDILHETGLKENPFSIIWLSEKPVWSSTSKPGFVSCDSSSESCIHSKQSSGKSEVNFISAAKCDSAANCVYRISAENDRNYESLVLMKMRQMEERKRLIEQMMKEDEEEG